MTAPKSKDVRFVEVGRKNRFYINPNNPCQCGGCGNYYEPWCLNRNSKGRGYCGGCWHNGILTRKGEKIPIKELDP